MGLRNLNFVMISVRSESWRMGMETRRVMMKGRRESLNVLAVIFVAQVLTDVPRELCVQGPSRSLLQSDRSQ